MTRDTLTEILRHVAQEAEGGFSVAKGRELAVHLGKPGDGGLAVGPVSRVDLEKTWVRFTTSRGQQFFALYEDVTVVAEGPEGRSGFGNG